FLVADFRGTRAREILFKARELQSISAFCGEDRLPSTTASRRSSEKARRKIPVIRPIQERRMRSTAKDKNKSGFIGSFGRTNDPFPTLLAGSVNIFSFWYEGKEQDGYIRQLTPLECERLMGLPEGWTAFGSKNEIISDYARYKALGNAIAVPCAIYHGWYCGNFIDKSTTVSQIPSVMLFYWLDQKYYYQKHLHVTLRDTVVLTLEVIKINNIIKMLSVDKDFRMVIADTHTI